VAETLQEERECMAALREAKEGHDQLEAYKALTGVMATLDLLDDEQVSRTVDFERFVARVK